MEYYKNDRTDALLLELSKHQFKGYIKSISNNLVKFTCQILSYSKLLICLAKEKKMCLQ